MLLKQKNLSSNNLNNLKYKLFNICNFVPNGGDRNIDSSDKTQNKFDVIVINAMSFKNKVLI